MQCDIISIVPCKVIQIPEIREILASWPVESWNPDAVNYWNPKSKFHLQGIGNPAPGIRNPQSGIQNPRLSWITLYVAISSSRLSWVCNPDF